MVFKKRRLSRGRVKRRFVRRTRGSRSTRSKRFIKGVIRRMSEIKFSTASNAVNILNNLPFITSLVPTFPQGVDKNNRIGNRIKYKYIQLRFALDLNQGVAPTSSTAYWRMIVFWTRLPLSVAPALTDILFTAHFLSSVRNTNVRVITDKTYLLTPAGVVTDTQRPNAVFYKKKFRTFQEVNFSNAADQIPRDPKDNLYCCLFSNNLLGVNDTNLDFTWNSRFSYTDF